MTILTRSLLCISFFAPSLTCLVLFAHVSVAQIRIDEEQKRIAREQLEAEQARERAAQAAIEAARRAEEEAKERLRQVRVWHLARLACFLRSLVSSHSFSSMPPTHARLPTRNELA